MDMGADSFRVLIGIAEVAALDIGLGAAFSLRSGEGDIPAGVDMLSGKMKSSMIIDSGCSVFWSDDFRS